MKSTILASLLLATTAFAVAQTQAQSSVSNIQASTPQSQSDCPVVFTNIALKSQSHVLPVRAERSSSGNLGFEYKNQSGKAIQSIAIRVELNTKKSLYELDAMTTTTDMVITGKAVEAALPAVGYVYGINRVTLEQLTYTDGTIWSAGKQVCQYNHSNTAEQIGKLQ